jgi:hypothetical protein
MSCAGALDGMPTAEGTGQRSMELLPSFSGKVQH